MKPEEVRELPTEDIDRIIAERRRAVFNLRFQKETQQVDRPSEIRKARRDVARLLTIRGERERVERAGASKGRSK